MDKTSFIDLAKSIQRARQKPGGSNVGKYKGVKSFCGPAGGAPSGSYPVNSAARAKSAMKLAHHAPNPSGIKKCAQRALAKMGG